MLNLLLCPFGFVLQKQEQAVFVLQKMTPPTYNYVAEYTINASDTWEHKTITIEPNSDIKAASGAIVNDNGLGMQVTFVLAYGSNYTAGVNNTWNDSADFATTNQINHMDSTSNDFYLTGVQLEVGDTATDFEHRSFGDELARCQRYYFRIDADESYKRYANGVILLNNSSGNHDLPSCHNEGRNLALRTQEQAQIMRFMMER